MNANTAIYFQKTPKLHRISTLIFTTAYKFFLPKQAMKFARNTLLLPNKYQKKPPTTIISKKLTIKNKTVMTYEMGTGPEIILIHGWSGGAFQYYTLMKKIAKLGYKAISFDFIGHGLSQRGITSLPNMINTLDEIQSLNHYSPELVVCHSMGSSVFANSQWFKTYKNKLLLISPLLQTHKMLVKSSQDSGFNQSLFNKVVKEAGEIEGLIVEKLNAEQYLYLYEANNIIIVHDNNDPFAPVKDSENLAKEINCKLVTSSKIGHGRMINSSITYSQIKELLLVK